MLTYQDMTLADISRVIPMYIDYYNTVEGSCWTEKTVTTRLRQVLTINGSCCLLALIDDEPIGFVIGYYQQFDDIATYNLAEIVIARENQGKGCGSALMQEIEQRVKAGGASSIELSAVNDAMHAHFYEEKFAYGRVGNQISLCKWIGEDK